MKRKIKSELSVLAGKYRGSLSCSQRDFDRVPGFPLVERVLCYPEFFRKKLLLISSEGYGRDCHA